VLLAGDVFDSPAPPAEAEKLVYDFLARLLPERIACVVIAGNHDHPRRLAALAQLLEGLRIHVRADVRPPTGAASSRCPAATAARRHGWPCCPSCPSARWSMPAA
jgi:DNA repair exonuclease SbcCD nuclease subunit